MTPPNEAITQEAPSQWRVDFSRDGIFVEDYAQSFSVAPDRWEQIVVPLPTDWKGGDLRLDPGDGFGLVDVAGVRVRTAAGGVEAWKLLGGDLAAAARVSGSARVIPGARMLRVLCAGPDARMILPAPALRDYDEPLTLEVGLCLRTELPALDRAFRELAASLEQTQAADADRLAELQRTREALHESWDQHFDQDTELQALRAEREESAREEDCSRKEITSLRAEVDDLLARLREKDESHAPTAPSGSDPAPEDGGYRFSLDVPTHWDFPTQQVDVQGWCLPPEDSGEEAPLLRFHHGNTHTDVRCDLPRPDVQALFGGDPRWFFCGFSAVLDLPTGLSEVIVEAVEKSGRVWRVGSYAVRTPYAERTRVIPADPVHDYGEWVERFDRLSVADRRRMRAGARALGYRPVISVVMPVYNAPEPWLVRAIESVRAQLYPCWELCIADDASPLPHVREVLERYARQDARIKVAYRETNGHISAASNTALSLATGEFVALLDHDDELAPHALYAVAARLNEQPGLQMIYSDEDKIDEQGQRSGPYFKPDWNYDLFLSQNLFSHLGVYRRSLLTKIGGFQLGLEGSQDYDLALRCLERIRPEEVSHIPQVLYHWRTISGSTALGGDEKPYTRLSARRAIREHLARLGIDATVEENPWIPDYHRVRRPLPMPPPEVAIIIPTRDAVEVLRMCIESILHHTDYPDYRIVVVDNGSRAPETFAYFEELSQRLPGRFRVLGYPGEFNYSAINNFAVREAGAPLLCLLNNDIEARDPGWLTELVSQAVRPEVGAVGARLLHPSGTLQHGGLIIGLGSHRTAGHLHYRLPGAEYGYFGRPKLIGQFSAVTGACLVLRGEVFDAVDGFNEADFPVALNDVDLCLRLRERGYIILYTPFAELYHHESYSRGVPARGTPAAKRTQGEVERLQQRHWRFLRHDPAYNPNLTLDHPNCAFSVPPREVPMERGQPTDATAVLAALLSAPADASEAGARDTVPSTRS